MKSFLVFVGFILTLLGLLVFRPHFMGHHWKWGVHQDMENFIQDYGECRSQSLLGAFPDVDQATLNALMRGRGWNMVCSECRELRW